MGLHCWMTRHEHVEEVYGYLSPEYCESAANGVDATCMLPADHDGEHEWTPDNEIQVSFVPRPEEAP